MVHQDPKIVHANLKCLQIANRLKIRMHYGFFCSPLNVLTKVLGYGHVTVHSVAPLVLFLKIDRLPYTSILLLN